MNYDIHVIGGGLAGSEAAWQLAEAGLTVRLSEMRGGADTTPAHHGGDLAELVCSNSFRSDDATSNAVGLLHQKCGRSARSSWPRVTPMRCPRGRLWPSTAMAFRAG